MAFICKQGIAFLLLLALLGQTFSKGIIVADFYVNRDAIARTLCVNRDRPGMHCNGRCQLCKRLAQENNKDKDAPERKDNAKSRLLISQAPSDMTIPGPPGERLHHFPDLSDDRLTDRPSFQYIHTYQWLDFLGKGKPIVEFVLIALAFLTTLLGICIFFSTRSKKVAGNSYTRARKNHRYTAIIVSLFTLMFTFSGAFHALYRLKEDTRDRYFVHDRFATTTLRLDFPALIALTHRPIADIGIVSMDAHPYWRLTALPAAAGKPKDLMKDQHAAQPDIYYVDAASASPVTPAPRLSVAEGLPQAMPAILPDGEARYAGWLATQFGGHPATDIVRETSITRFDNEYNFTDKRLPVWKVSYASNGHERYFVETSTGRLSVRVDDNDLIEAYSFALLHKHEFLGWAGKSVKDASTMFWAAAQLVLVLGLTLYFAWRRRQH